ncbi:MAG: hypothetical protein H0W96_15705 [Solirubrobacterales bacterium]|nr:hypothetical protein [Solirubrobacterales bacterium]
MRREASRRGATGTLQPADGLVDDGGPLPEREAHERPAGLGVAVERARRDRHRSGTLG